MDKFKTFIIGMIIGSMLTGGAAYASDKFHIEVQFPKFSYWNDQEELSGSIQNSTFFNGKNSVPLTILYEGTSYVPARFIANALGKELEWDGNNQRIILHESNPLTIEPIQAIPKEVAAWIERSKTIEAAQTLTVNHETYILVTYGEKNTGGYEVNILHVERDDKGGARVVVRLTDPVKGMPVSQAVTYPYELVKLKSELQAPIDFSDVNGKTIVQLKGFSSIPPYVKKTNNIILFDAKLQKDNVIISGAVRTFDGIVHVGIRNVSGKYTIQHPIQASDGLPNWGYFTDNIPLSQLKEGDQLNVYMNSLNGNNEPELLEWSLDGLLIK